MKAICRSRKAARCLTQNDIGRNKLMCHDGASGMQKIEDNTVSAKKDIRRADSSGNLQYAKKNKGRSNFVHQSKSLRINYLMIINNYIIKLT